MYSEKEKIITYLGILLVTVSMLFFAFTDSIYWGISLLVQVITLLTWVSMKIVLSIGDFVELQSKQLASQFKLSCLQTQIMIEILEVLYEIRKPKKKKRRKKRK